MRRPNVVVVVLDDLGFAELGCFGSGIATPVIDGLARQGLRYTNFHATPLCSPTRASLLTGRNHHAIGMGMLSDLPAQAPGYTGRIPRSAATLSHHLRASGYGTFAVGKWHIAPRDDSGPAGPYDRWPLQMGFDRFYGFMRGLTDQWFPALVRDNSSVDQPQTPDEGYHLTEDLTTQALEMMQTHRAGRPEDPFFLYYAPGAMHSPHQAPASFIERYRGAFDHGWDEERERRFQRQLAEGVIPPGTVNTPRPPSVPAWDDLDDDAHRVFARQMEVYAGFLEHTDQQIGRLVDYLELSGQLDDTIIWVTSDNGAAHHPSRAGTWAKFAANDVPTMLEHLDEFGGVGTANHYARGWTWAGTTPFQYWKGYSWLGGVRTPLILHWPARIGDGAAAVRSQFAHVIDVMPTILDAVGVAAEPVVDGVEQQPIDGASMMATVDDEQAPSPRRTQYFEMLGSRSVYHDGWRATTDHLPYPDMWEQPMEGSTDFAADHWSLFDLAADFSEARDLSAQEPERLQRMIELWDAEAAANQVLPFSDSPDRPDSVRADAGGPGPSRRILFPAEVPVTTTDLFASSFDLTVEIEAGAAPSGVLWAHHPSPYTFSTRPIWAGYVAEGRPTVTFGFDADHVLTGGALAGGRHTLSVTVERASSGEVALKLLVDGEESDAAVLNELALPPVSQLYIGRGTGLPRGDYHPDRRFDGRIHRVVIDRR
ncbi:arylsulfatase [Microbacterium sp. 1.5R]|uniref:arylsulfatase n=1 Tax=Microbacterium sp. 1.5R TaxID=1916917 RepID=UPI0011A102F5|nr:arylsulfatase [Microbacterium sp. 1.5R]